jgi:hypothetical protein
VENQPKELKRNKERCQGIGEDHDSCLQIRFKILGVVPLGVERCSAYVWNTKQEFLG